MVPWGSPNPLCHPHSCLCSLFPLPPPRGSEVGPTAPRSSGLTTSHLDIAVASSLPPASPPGHAPHTACHLPKVSECTQPCHFPAENPSVWAAFIGHRALHIRLPSAFLPPLPPSLPLSHLLSMGCSLCYSLWMSPHLSPASSACEHTESSLRLGHLYFPSTWHRGQSIF